MKNRTTVYIVVMAIAMIVLSLLGEAGMKLSAVALTLIFFGIVAVGMIIVMLWDRHKEEKEYEALHQAAEEQEEPKHEKRPVRRTGVMQQANSFREDKTKKDKKSAKKQNRPKNRT